MFLGTRYLCGALFNLVACASFVTVGIPGLKKDVRISSVGRDSSMWYASVSSA